MLAADEIILSLECEPSELADPQARAAMNAFGHQLATAGVTPAHQLHFRSGSIVASATSLGPYLVPLAAIIVPALTTVLVAWIKAAPGRKVRVRMGDVRIETSSVEDLERVIPLLTAHQAKTGKKMPKR